MTTRPLWSWLGLLVAVGALSQATIHLIRPATTYKLLELGAHGGTIGVVSGIYALLPLIVAVQVGVWTQRALNLRLLLTCGSIVVVLGVASIAIWNTVWTVAVGSALLGLGQLIFTIAAQAVVARFALRSQMDTAFGWFTAGFSLGQFVGPLLGGFVLDAELVGATGTRMDTINLVIWIGGFLSLLGVACLQFSRNIFRSPKSSPRDSFEPNEEPAEAPGQRPSVRRILRVRGMKSHLLASVAMLSVLDVLSAFLPLLGQDAGLSARTVGILLAVRAAASIVSRALLPVLRRTWSRSVLVLSALTLSGGALAIVPWSAGSLIWMTVLMAVAGFFLGLGQPLTMSLVAQAVPDHWQAPALAVRLMGNRFGQVVVPVGAGALASSLGSGGAIWAGCLILFVSGAEKAISSRKK